MRGFLCTSALLLALPLSIASGADPAELTQTAPTDADLRAAYEVKVESINAGGHSLLSAETASRLAIKPIKVSLVECDPIGAPATHYLCSAMVEASIGDQDAEVKRVELILHREGPAWQVQ
jgi:hypothetical protein